MTSLNLALAHAVKLALLVAFAGVLVRGRARQCWAFPAYLATVLVANSLGSFWPARFHTPQAWVVFQGAYDLLKMVVVLELAWRAFAVFPGAMRSARVVLLLLLAASTGHTAGIVRACHRLPVGLSCVLIGPRTR